MWIMIRVIKRGFYLSYELFRSTINLFVQERRTCTSSLKNQKKEVWLWIIFKNGTYCLSPCTLTECWNTLFIYFFGHLYYIAPIVFNWPDKHDKKLIDLIFFFNFGVNLVKKRGDWTIFFNFIIKITFKLHSTYILIERG